MIVLIMFISCNNCSNRCFPGIMGSMGETVSSLWESLKAEKPDDLARRSGSVYRSSENCYSVPVLSGSIDIFPDTGSIRENRILEIHDNSDPDHSLEILMLHYLLNVPEKIQQGKFVKPESLPGGDIYRRGVHMLPLVKVAARYGGDRSSFLERGRLLGGFEVEYGDSAVHLHPVPRVPMVLILWEGDEEFEPRASLLIDSAAGDFLAPDILWGLSMLTVDSFLLP